MGAAVSDGSCAHLRVLVEHGEHERVVDLGEPEVQQRGLHRGLELGHQIEGVPLGVPQSHVQREGGGAQVLARMMPAHLRTTWPLSPYRATLPLKKPAKFCQHLEYV
eukprot:550644-Pyramimonas_sp.AAC.1